MPQILLSASCQLQILYMRDHTVMGEDVREREAVIQFIVLVVVALKVAEAVLNAIPCLWDKL